jgi:hemolysin activation/secretion protein
MLNYPSLLLANLFFIKVRSFITLVLSMWFFGAALLQAHFAFAADINLSDEKNPVNKTTAPNQPQAGTVKFDIWEYQLQGNSLLSTVQIENALYPYLGSERGIEAVEAAAENLEKIYRAAGFPTVYVDIPEQDVRSGIVTLSVTEGKVGRLRVKGSRYFTLSGIKAQIPSLQEGQPLNIAQLQAEISQANKLTSDLSIAPIIKAGKNPGEIDVDLNVKDTLPVHGDLEYNNFNSPDTERGRLRGSISYNNLWQKAHGLILTAQVTPDDTQQLSVFSASYSAPWEDKRIAAFAVKSKTNVTSSVGTTVSSGAGGGLNVVGDGEIYGLRLIQPLASIDDYMQSAIFGVDYKSFTNTVELDLQRPIEYSTQSMAYNGSWLAPEAVTHWNISAVTGMDGVVNDQKQFTENRVDARAGFMYLKFGVSREDVWGVNSSSDNGFDIFSDWKTRAAFDSQLSQAPLINNEQYSLGGQTTVRGYYESQTFGDQGFALQLELYTPPLRWLKDKNTAWIREARLMTFYDIGGVYLHDALPDEKPSQTLRGTGIGLHIDVLSDLSLMWDYSWALNSIDTIDAGDQRTNFRFLYNF